jgi:hypothetical protein
MVPGSKVRGRDSRQGIAGASPVRCAQKRGTAQKARAKRARTRDLRITKPSHHSLAGPRGKVIRIYDYMYFTRPLVYGERLTSAVVPLLGKACLYPSRTSNEQHQATTKTQRISAQRDAQLCVKRERTAIANTPVKRYIGDLLCNTLARFMLSVPVVHRVQQHVSSTTQQEAPSISTESNWPQQLCIQR